ncbi:hypothetical protein PsorP6_017730 [Peronosclerospora sorghi]|uniref:Uncharacterized protein n=1 Tax=Peronosclerospora sorghi TaxID=230839 RepID=A0ACC0WL60_9STRA|nr:hypothetical protein PsorP6_017730 [Peronosclerospora sorghi]
MILEPRVVSPAAWTKTDGFFPHDAQLLSSTGTLEDSTVLSELEDDVIELYRRRTAHASFFMLLQ